jgi:hypothetical protein
MQCKRTLRDSDKTEELVRFFAELNGNTGQDAMIYALNPRRSVGDVWMWNAIALADSDPVRVFRCLHLVLRAQALANYVYRNRSRGGLPMDPQLIGRGPSV